MSTREERFLKWQKPTAKTNNEEDLLRENKSNVPFISFKEAAGLNIADLVSQTESVLDEIFKVKEVTEDLAKRINNLEAEAFRWRGPIYQNYSELVNANLKPFLQSLNNASNSIPSIESSINKSKEFVMAIPNEDLQDMPLKYMLQDTEEKVTKPSESELQMDIETPSFETTAEIVKPTMDELEIESDVMTEKAKKILRLKEQANRSFEDNLANNSPFN